MSNKAALKMSYTILLIAVLALITPALLLVSNANAAMQVQNRSLTLNSAIAGAAPVKYQMIFDIPNIASLGSIKINLCSNSPLPEAPCTGFTGNGLSTISSINVTGLSNFVLSSVPTQTELILTRPLQAAAAGTVNITMEGVTNPASNGSYYGRVALYSNISATDPAIYDGGYAISINDAVSVNTEVPPYLEFCTSVTIGGIDCNNIGSSYYDFGEFSKTRANTATSQFVTASNAGNGYAVTYFGTTMTSGNNTISPLSNLSQSNPGSSQFGINLRQNSNPSIGQEVVGAGPYPTVSAQYNQPNSYYFNSGDSVIQVNEPTYALKHTVSYVVNVSNSQPPGYYSTSIMFQALANF